MRMWRSDRCQVPSVGFDGIQQREDRINVVRIVWVYPTSLLPWSLTRTTTFRLTDQFAESGRRPPPRHQSVSTCDPPDR